MLSPAAPSGQIATDGVRRDNAGTEGMESPNRGNHGGDKDIAVYGVGRVD